MARVPRQRFWNRLASCTQRVTAGARPQAKLRIES